MFFFYYYSSCFIKKISSCVVKTLLLYYGHRFAWFSFFSSKFFHSNNQIIFFLFTPTFLSFRNELNNLFIFAFYRLITMEKKIFVLDWCFMLQNKKKYREKLRLEGPNLTLSNKLFFFYIVDATHFCWF